MASAVVSLNSLAVWVAAMTDNAVGGSISRYSHLYSSCCTRVSISTPNPAAVQLAFHSRTKKNGCPGTPYKGVRQQHVFVRLLFAADVFMLEAHSSFCALHLSGL